MTSHIMHHCKYISVLQNTSFQENCSQAIDSHNKSPVSSSCLTASQTCMVTGRTFETGSALSSHREMHCAPVNGCALRPVDCGKCLSVRARGGGEVTKRE